MIYYREYTEMLIKVMTEIKNRFGFFPTLPEESNFIFLIKKIIFRILDMVKYQTFK